MADINQLNLTSEPVEVDFEHYVDPSEFPPPVPAGVYTLLQGKPGFMASKEGYLTALFDDSPDAKGTPHLIEGGEFDKQPIRFDRVSTKLFERTGQKASMIADQIRAVHGATATPQGNQAYADAIEQGEGRPFKASLDWEGYCAIEQKTVIRGMRNFPTNQSNGKHVEETPCPNNCLDASQNPVNIRARVRIVRRIPA